MKPQVCRAVVLRSIAYAEADRIVTLLTREGRVAAMAKSARWPQVSADLFAMASLLANRIGHQIGRSRIAAE